MITATRNKKPQPVDGALLQRLCQDTARNADAIKLILWDLSDIVAHEIKGIDHDEAQVACFEGMVKAIRTYSQDKQAIGYFYQAARWKGWRAGEKGLNRLYADVQPVLPEDRIARERGNFPMPIDEPGQEKPQPPTDPLACIDYFIRRARDAIRRHRRLMGDAFDAEDREYQAMEMMIRNYQDLRFAITGSYLLMRTPALNYQAERIIPRLTDEVEDT